VWPNNRCSSKVLIWMNILHPDTIVPQFASSDHVFGSAYLSLFSESQREEARDAAERFGIRVIENR
jgi:hypothetical protein